ncbi:protein NRT1/ PTR FAMILY 2.13-like [Lolium rigidum]|uniref:protein NRT1/ PTR FAMILY 2.13-like n=1 Tax=Lolium rigidum TaxID=89674 RepID=UPI001F5D564B|nr:protein NRT1/ PTR FAMILY 2.13-like [Lolium rigidum]
MCDGGRPEAPVPPTASGKQSGAGNEAGEEAGVGMTPRPSGWMAVMFIIGFFTAMAMAFSAFSQPITNYLIKHYNMKANAATDLANIFTGTSSFSPVVGAFVADAFCGRFRTLLFGTIAGLLGMVAITLTATIRQLKPPSCSVLARQAGTCAGASGIQRAVLYVAMGLLVVGMGGTSPTSLPFGADQFDERRHKEGLRRYYGGYYVFTMMATFLALTVIAYVQDNVSWGHGFAIPTALMLATFAVFLVGTPWYVYVPPEGSIFASVARVAVASGRKWRLRLPHPNDAQLQEALLYSEPPPAAGRAVVFRLPLTPQLSFLNKAAIVTDADEKRADGFPARPWNLCSVQQVEEVKCIVKIIPIWVSGMLWFIGMVEISNYTFLQALTMDLHMGKSFSIPPVSIIAIFYISVALFVPIYELLIATVAQRLTKTEGGLTLLQRQGVGFAISVLSFVVAAMVERRRRDSALGHGGTSPLSVFLVAPQLVVMGLSAAFSMVGQMEFYNTQFPHQMRTLGNAAFYCAQGAGNYLATLVVKVVNTRTRLPGGGGWVSDDINAGRLDYFYYSMAVFGAVNLVYFLVCSNFYRYKDQ